MSESKGIKNIIFDFGGVLFDIDFKLSHEAFAKLGLDTERHFGSAAQSGLFDRLETGVISEADFFSELRLLSGNEALNDETLREAWNALLLELPRENFELLQRLSGNYNLFLLSNTNVIHASSFLSSIDQLLGAGAWPSVFRKAYYSFEIGMRKPGREIFDWVLKDAGLNPGETLFLDDGAANLEGARAVGIQVLLVNRPVTELLKGF